MPERPTNRMRTMASGYMIGMMIDDERAMDEFINTLKTKPELYEKLKEKLE